MRSKTIGQKRSVGKTRQEQCGPCLECGRLVRIEPRSIASCVVAGRTVPFLGCELCQNEAACRIATARSKGTSLRDICRRDRARRARLARRHLRSRILPIAKALLLNVDTAG